MIPTFLWLYIITSLYFRVNGIQVGFLSTQVEFKSVCVPGALAKVTDFMSIYRISVGKMSLTFSLYFNFIITILANTGRERLIRTRLIQSST